MACNHYTIFNPGLPTKTVSFTDCSGGTCSFNIASGETYYANADTSSPPTGAGLTITNNDGVADWFSFSGSCSPTETFSFGYRTAGTGYFVLGKIYCLSEAGNCDTEPDSITQQCFEVVDDQAPLYMAFSYVKKPTLYDGSVLEDCLIQCPCAPPTPTPTPTPTVTPTNTSTPTPTQTVTPTNTSTPTQTPTETQTPTPTTTNTLTPTQTTTSTPTPTPTQTLPNCQTSYCITNTGFIYDDNYQKVGSYNGKDYWSGVSNGYFIYYDNINIQWCLSNTLGGSCFLFGKSPCTSVCPDLCDEYFDNGVCPTPTPTPTINCDIFDFQAIFNCDITATPSSTPTNTPTPTLTPTPSSTDFCGYLNLSASVNTYSPTPTPTPTNTPSSSPEIQRPYNFSGDVTFNTLDATILCASSVKFQDCYDGNFYFTTNSVLVPNGGNLQQFMIFKAKVDGEVKCISYLEVDTQTIGVNDIKLLEGPVGYSNLGGCVFCTPEVSKTPTPTPTTTIGGGPGTTPTPTQTPTPTATIGGGPGTTPTPTQTPTSTIGGGPGTTPTPTQTPTSTIGGGPVTTPTPTQTPTSTIGGGPVTTPTPTPTQTPTPTPLKGKIFQNENIFTFMNDTIYIFEGQ